jgi:hypothetical protein
MDEQTIIKTLTENGGKLWEKGTMRRVYFNPETVMKMDVNHYNSGNVSSASINGEGISNSEAGRALECKFWYDLADGQFHDRGTDRLHRTSMTAIQDFYSDLKARI